MVKDLFSALLEELSADRPAMICTVVSSSGSTPRRAGARMLVRADGSTVDTVGGGQLEWEAIQLAKQLCRSGHSCFHSWNLTPAQAADAGMICGGSAELYFQACSPSDPVAAAVARDILQTQAEGRRAWLILSMEENGWHGGVLEDGGSVPSSLADLPRERMSALLGEKPMLDRGAPTLYTEPLGQRGTVYLFGAGHVGLALTHLLSLVSFRVMVCDQRPNAAEQAREADSVLCAPYEDIFSCLPPIGPEDYIVIMTPGHQGDYQVLRQALRTPARYIGCIGSRRKNAAVRERLSAEGFGPETLDRIHAPIGLDIGGETPEEIALSVAAQLVACRSGKPLGKRGAP